MNAIEAIKAAQAESKAEVSSFTVPAWSTEEEDFIIYHKPFTLADVDWIDKQAGNSKAKSLALTVIRKALDEDGKKLFTLKDLNYLQIGVRSTQIVEIVNDLNKDDQGVDFSEE